MLVLALMLSLLAAPATRPGEVGPLVAEVEAAHGRGEVPAGHVLHGTITVTFGENALLDAAEIWFDANGGLVRIETGDGATAVLDGTTAHLSPPDADIPRPRFQLLTWPYFAVNAFKLRDGGADLAMMDPAPLREGEQPMRRMLLTFAAGTGDSPDDWYVLYLDDAGRLVSSAYIVTYGTPAAEAEQEPHAIVYADFQDVPLPDGTNSGVVLSPTWTFYDWSEADGLVGEPRGSVEIEDLRFVETPAGAFDAPRDSREVVAP